VVETIFVDPIMTPPTGSIRIMLVEDSAEYRRVIAMAIDDQPDMELVRHFGTTEVALRTLSATAATNQPDILLLDLRLPGMGGLEAIPLIRKAAPAVRIIVLSQSDEPQDIYRAIAAGVSGYLLKSATLEEIATGIRMVAAGGASLDKHVARYILDAMRPLKTAATPLLTDREREILELLAEGLVKKEIARRLGIGYATVDTHVSHIYAKLNVANAPAAVSRAYERGILPARPIR
jgi:DNA-binding NarL/FixJ family response regulator